MLKLSTQILCQRKKIYINRNILSSSVHACLEHIFHRATSSEKLKTFQPQQKQIFQVRKSVDYRFFVFATES